MPMEKELKMHLKVMMMGISLAQSQAQDLVPPDKNW